MRMRDLLVDVLATYRLTVLVIDDVITEPLREKIFEKHDPREHGWSYVLTCPWCASMWIGMGVMISRRVAPRKWDVVAKALAASAITANAYGRLN